jgi:ArsR family transcriptional regulator
MCLLTLIVQWGTVMIKSNHHLRLTLFWTERYNGVGDNMEDLNQRFKALSDETRMKIYMMLSERTLCACQLLSELDISQPTLSHHMKILESSGWVTTEKKGTWTHYHIDEDTVQAFIDFFRAVRDKERDETEVFSCDT